MARTLRSRHPEEGSGQRVALRLTDMAYEGQALGRLDGKVVFASYGIPDEEVVVEVREEHRQYTVAQVVDVQDPSPHRVEPRCPHFGTCGGCQLQHIAYPQQLELKKRVVAEQLRRIGKFVRPPLSPALPAPDPWHYRNHARFTVGREGRLGYTHWHTQRFVPIDHCYIAHPWINAAKTALDGVDRRLHQIALRYSANTGGYVVHPPLPSVSGYSSGQPWYEESLFGVRFRVSAASFFQVHTAQAERLAALVRDRLSLRGTELVVDAYAGVGTFAVLLAPFTARILAIEESAAAVRDAKANVQGLGNVQILEAKTETALEELKERPDAVILDPPRTGCEPQALRALIRLRPQRIVYVSCDPATLARDLHILALGGFRLENVTPIDMFPQTYHVECVATLVLGTPGDLLLASTSPRRVELLGRLGVPFQALVPLVEETKEPGQEAARQAEENARRKAVAIASQAAMTTVGVDTLVVSGDGEVLGKPQDAADARRMLQKLQGRGHTVVTGVAVARPGGALVHSASLTSRVHMREYSDKEMESYIATGDPMDKAGAYAVQDASFHPAASVDGCYLNVVGLPVCLVDRLLRESGHPFPPTARPVEPPRCLYCAADRPPGG